MSWPWPFEKAVLWIVWPALHFTPHVVVEGLLLVFIAFLFLRPSYRLGDPSKRPLTEDEISELIASWAPTPRSPLPPTEGPAIPELLLQSRVSAHITATVATLGQQPIERTLLNLSTRGWLGFQADPTCLEAAIEALAHYGLGSCGPRGFYGTTELHLRLERALAAFLGSEDALVTSSAAVTLGSVLPAFVKLDDVIFVDVGVGALARRAIRCCRARVHWFAHNDPEDLARLLVRHGAAFERSRRVFVIAQGIYTGSGAICALPPILKLRTRYPFRLILDESETIGVLGATGRGLTEHYGIDVTEITLVIGSLDQTLGSGGGFVACARGVADHLRLNASGYVFSCSSPPYLLGAAVRALEVLASGEAAPRLAALRANAAALHHELLRLEHFDAFHEPLSPLASLAIRGGDGGGQHLQAVIAGLLDRGILVNKDPDAERISVLISAQHNPQEIAWAVRQIDAVGGAAVGQVDASPAC